MGYEDYLFAQAEIYEPVTLHWYDRISSEGLFKTKDGNPVLANFELEPESHELALKGENGQVFQAVIVRTPEFTQIACIKK